MPNDIEQSRQLYVAKSNSLINKSRFSLSLQQQKIILYLISKIQPTDEDFTTYSFSISEYCKVCGINHASGKNHSDLRNQIKELADKSIWYTLPNGDETLIRWIEKPYISRRKGEIRIRFDNDMKPFLLQLRNYYTQYQILYILCMQSRYSLRLYELLLGNYFDRFSSYSKIFSVDELRTLLDAKKYDKFSNFNNYVLKIAVNEINKYTDINVIANQIKSGKKTTAIEFIISTKDIKERLAVELEIEKALDKQEKEKTE